MFVAYREAGNQQAHPHRESLAKRSCAVALPPRPIRSAMDVEKALVPAICRRTRGQVRSLQVQIVGSRVVLRGWAASYYAIQLAIAGLFEAFREMNLDRPEEVELDIDVPGSSDCCAPRPR